MNDTLIASRRHTAIALLIVVAIALVGMRQGPSLATAARPDVSRAVPYLTLIALQLLWVRFINAGLKSAGHSLSVLTGGPWISARSALADFGLAAIAGFAAWGLATVLTGLIGGGPANTAFLLPHGFVESVLWVLVSVTAGVCEEIVFRGYLQRQLTALTGSLAAGILLQAVAFGVSHGYQGYGSIATTGSYGLVLGVLAWWRGNVRPCALAHAATDIVGGLARF